MNPPTHKARRLAHSIRLGLRSAALAASLSGVASCGVGVPVTIRVDEFTTDLSLDDGVDSLTDELRTGGILPPGTLDLPEVWPEELPDACFDFLAQTDPDLGGRIDLTPDPATDPDAAEQFEQVNDGLVERIELENIIVRVEQNTLNVSLPTIEIQAADALDASGQDRRAWRTLGTIGGDKLGPGCEGGASEGVSVPPGELADLDFRWHRGGESFLDSQLVDPRCPESDPLGCKELSIRARSRVRLDTRAIQKRPRGAVRLRLIIVATFYLKPV